MGSKTASEEILGATMSKEFKLIIYAIGENEAEAIESAVKMLNEGATFDEIDLLEVRPKTVNGA